MENGSWQAWWPVLGGRSAASAPVSVIAPSLGRLDAFVAGQDGKVYTAAWDKKVSNAHWRGWWKVQNGSIPAEGHVSAVSRDANKLDIFIVSTDGGIYTAAWDANFSNGQWRGWWAIQNGKAKDGGIAAVARHANQLDVFAIGLDQSVWTAAWNAGVANGQWKGW